MNKKRLMGIVLLALSGFILIILSIYLLYKSENNTLSSKKQFELEEAIKQIEVLHAEIVTKGKLVEEKEQKIQDLKSVSISESLGQNIPVIELVDNDLSEGDSFSEDGIKKHRLMYHHQIRFYLLNIGKSSLKDVIFSIKDKYSQEIGMKKAKKGSNYAGKSVLDDELGAYENIEVNTLNLKTKKSVYIANLPDSFGVGDYEFHVVVEWSHGFYQMHVNIEELDGKLKYKFEFFDVNGKPFDFKSLEKSISN